MEFGVFGKTSGHLVTFHVNVCVFEREREREREREIEIEIDI